jgi:tetratricopeptide (TPR) repeat protein
MFQIGGAQGRKLCEDSLTIFREIGSRQEEAYTLSLIADTATRHSEAEKFYERSLQLSREINDRRRVAGRLMDLGILATVQGDLSTAAQHLQESLRIYREIGERNREALQLSSRAIVYKWQGRLDEAENSAQQAISILQEVRGNERPRPGKAEPGTHSNGSGKAGRCRNEHTFVDRGTSSRQRSWQFISCEIEFGRDLGG